MTITANLADGRVLNFPDGTDPQVIQNTVKRMISGSERSNEDVPTPENLAIPAPGNSSPSFGDQLLGGLENAASLASAIPATIGGGVSGLATTLITGDPAAGAAVSEGVSDTLSFQPSTQAGVQQQQTIGDFASGVQQNVINPAVAGTAGLVDVALNPVTNIAGGFEQSQNVVSNVREKGIGKSAGDQVLEATNSPFLAAATEILPAALEMAVPGKVAFNKIGKASRAKRKLIADEIRKGNPNIDLVTKALDEKGAIVTNKASKQALDILGGDLPAKQTISVIENMSPASKAQVRKMLDVVEKMRKNPVATPGQPSRPSDILGESVANRIRAISSINKNAGKKIGEAANSLKGKVVDITTARDSFFKDMQDLGVEFADIDGRVKANFDNSTFVGGGADKIERIANAIKTGKMDGLSAHRQKQFIRDLVSFGKGTESAVSSRSQGIFKGLASGIDEALDSTSTVYKKANDDFAKTVNLVEQFDKLAGKEIDVFSDLSAKSLGGKARRLASNAESRVNIEQQLIDADKVLKDFKITFKDDIPSLSHTVTRLEDIFKLEPAGSFQGRIERAGANIAQGQSASGAAAASVVDTIKSLKQPSFEKKMRAFRLLTKESEK
jgi:hypothetical protein